MSVYALLQRDGAADVRGRGVRAQVAAVDVRGGAGRTRPCSARSCRVPSSTSVVSVGVVRRADELDADELVVVRATAAVLDRRDDVAAAATGACGMLARRAGVTRTPSPGSWSSFDDWIVIHPLPVVLFGSVNCRRLIRRAGLEDDRVAELRAVDRRPGSLSPVCGV